MWVCQISPFIVGWPIHIISPNWAQIMTELCCRPDLPHRPRVQRGREEVPEHRPEAETVGPAEGPDLRRGEDGGVSVRQPGDLRGKRSGGL